MIDDAELLRRYSEENSEPAFAELVGRRLDFVYSVALRQTGGDTHRAQDAAQRVFTDLARKAASLARRPVLTGWLFRSAQFAATDLVRAESRRQVREAEAERMHDHLSKPKPNWDELRPVLDQALAELNERDRDALMLRFFEGQPFAAIGGQLRLTEDAARMRVERALEKLRVRLARLGVTSTAAALAGTLAVQSINAAPAGAAAAITSSALAVAGSVSGVGVGVTLANLFVMTKIKAGIVSAMMVAGFASALVEVRANLELNAEYQSLRAAGEKFARVQTTNKQLNVAVEKLAVKNPEANEIARLHARVAQLAARPTGVVDSEIRPLSNLGRATPAAAVQTFYWAVTHHDLDLASRFFRFSDDTKENRAAFMAHFSPEVQSRYPTPEHVCAAICIFSGRDPSDPGVAMQVISATEDHGPDQVKLTAWIRTASGSESGGSETYVWTPQGWGSKPVSLTDGAVLKLALERLDPATGDLVLPKR